MGEPSVVERVARARELLAARTRVKAIAALSGYPDDHSVRGACLLRDEYNLTFGDLRAIIAALTEAEQSAASARQMGWEEAAKVANTRAQILRGQPDIGGYPTTCAFALEGVAEAIRSLTPISTQDKGADT